MSNKQPLKYSEVPYIPRYLSPEDFYKVVPIDMYPEYIQSVTTLTEDKLQPSLRITFNPDIIEGVQNELIIPIAMLNSQLAGVETPLFLFENSTRKAGTKSLPYFDGKDNTDNRVLNMNQMIYLFIQHRLAYFKRVASNKKIYLDLLRNKDFKELKSFIEYQKPIAFNSLKKVENTYVIINNLVFNITKDNVIGERIKGNRFTEEEWQLVMRDLYPYLVPTSESSFNQKCKLVLSPTKKSIYRGPAFSFDSDVATSIFPFKPNIVARLKTHITGDGIELANPDKSCFKHDLVFENGKTKILDNTIKYAVVVFHPMDFESKRFVAGELEASETIARTLVIQQEHVIVITDHPDNLSVQEGMTYYPLDQSFDLTTAPSVDPVTQNLIDNCIYGVTNFTVKYIKPLGNNVIRVTIDKTMKAGNARVISKTGLKGVTNITGIDRHVYFAPVGKTVEDLEDTNVRDTILNMRCRKLKTSHPNYEFLQSVNGDLEQINSVSYKIVNPQILKDEGWTKHKVDIVTGMNAVKAKTNTIRLAQALMAVEMGYYTPTPKGKNGIYEGILDASNELEINQAADALPDFIYLDENNVPNKCYVGLVPINFTELGKTYAKFKKQSFSFESGNVIKSVQPELFDYIFANYLEEDKKDVCLDLYEIYEDFNGKLATKNDLPVMKLADIRKHIKPSDLFLASQTRNVIDSILFNTEFNPHGFVIDVRALAKKADSSFKTQLIRIPSANTLRYFMSVRNDGTYMYDPLLRVISRIFMPLLGYRSLKDLEEEQNQIKDYVPYYYLFSRKNSTGNESYQTSLDLYKSMLKGTVYSSADSSKQLTQSLIKPKVPGFSLKQVVHKSIPDDCIVLLNDHIRNKTFKEAGKSDLLDPDSDYNGILDIAIMVNTNQDRIDIKDALIDVLNQVPLLIVNRNPFLTF